MLKVGDMAPEFSLKSQDGESYSLKMLRGKRAVLYFYPKDETPGCTIEACEFRNHHQQFIAKGAVLMGISADSVESHEKFAHRHRLNFPLLADAGAATCKKYGVWMEKNFLGRKFMGISRTTFIIDRNGRIAAIFSKVNPLGHANGMLNALNLVREGPSPRPNALKKAKSGRKSK
ncbi:MAG TPA: thioredoxin-dependent thiol peroxidase [Candidatus Norongarragalinales archaeon]|nr:thioredoxin-dependent thiol peroxidase [Candidatus Norongarragalinales archaeon]